MNDPSPWMVNQLEDFLYFCCPECDTKEKDRESFLDHAFKEHPTTKGINHKPFGLLRNVKLGPKWFEMVLLSHILVAVYVKIWSK